MKKIVLTFGLIAGAILAAMMLLTQALIDDIGFDKGEIIGYTTMILAFLMVFFGVRAYRDNVAGGTVSFGKAFQVGILIVLVASACYVATWQLVYYKLAPDFAEKYSAYVIDKARADGATEQELAKRTNDMKNFAAYYKNPLINVGITFLEPLPVGLASALLAAIVFGRKRRVVAAI
jgi:hypothetical protein